MAEPRKAKEGVPALGSVKLAQGWLAGRYTPVECKVEARRGRVFEGCLSGRDARDDGFRCLRL